MSHGSRDDGEAEHWPWPDMSQPRSRPPERALNIKSRAEVSPPTPASDAPSAPEPWTAEALEAIRQAAFEAGYEEGKEQGFEAGKEEGRLTGLQQGHEAGLQQGLEQGLTEGQEKIDRQLQQWQQLVERLQTPLAQIDKVVEQSLVTLAQELARNLLKTEASTSPQLLLATVREAVDALPGHDGGVTLFVHPDDLALLEQHFDEQSRQKRGWELVSEPGQARGDLRVKTALSELDVSLARRIDDLMANFIKANWHRFHDAS
ncbi:flagellar assembly protein FliH [Oceanisphaera psychrotolerans]|uniref:Flagellar assembly protein FliH n=1 Tax=Oceanisphaera psychrotolerans TaxID=1414654 RepID=A0A1J4QBD6_9GAMM|nr:flagellar assembly protein FliH [Oceanisphaera psychrotolerans]OIN07713.1 flagellar assembly protein FliH [Oceanisphaera psychrotolerans]